MRGAPHIRIEGLTEFQRDLKIAEGKLPPAVGEVHKEIGRFIIERIPAGDPNAVGAGSGSAVRASANKREVQLRVGGSHRGARKDQWGKKEVQPFRSGRPYIVGALEENEDRIRDMFMKKYLDVLGHAFYSAE